ncbi:MAG TPA: alpha-L-rhamnosidase, partial [Planctomycetes bacterium]|nr:alpha-L-rhamnosidase [Planctomycetota bacterium]
THPWLQYQLYRSYGDRRILEDQWETTRRLVDFLGAKSKGGVIDKGISDHESLDPKPAALTGTAFHFACVDLLARFARILGRKEEAEKYAVRAEEIRKVFTDRFLSPGTGVFGKGTQASQAFPLFFGLVPGPERKAAVRAMVRAVLEDHQGHLATGMFGTYMLLHELSRAGRAEAAYRMVNQRTFPGWGYMLERGATALWEHWAFSDDTFSHDHPMFGSVDAWFYQWLRGIQPAPGAEGLDRLVLRPCPVGDLRWVKAHHEGVRGRIVSEWALEGGRFLWRLVLPPGVRARIYVPAKGEEEVLEGGKPARSSGGLRFLGRRGGAALFEAGSGEFRFSSPWEG